MGFIQIHILHHTSKEAVNGTWLMQELEEHGYKTSPGTLYPLLHKMESEGLLNRTSKNINGRISKLYTTTLFGDEILQDAVGKAAELFHELKE